MDSSKIKIKCHRCGKEYDMSEMRYGADSKHLECVYCLERKPHPEIRTAAASVKKAEQGLPEKKADAKDVVEYICSACRYSFTRKASASVARCPYCSKEGTISERSTRSAHSLLEESTDDKYDY